MKTKEYSKSFIVGIENPIEVRLTLRYITEDNAYTTDLEKVDKYYVFNVVAYGDDWSTPSPEKVEGEYKYPLFEEIVKLWKEYSNNNLHAGTDEQEKAVKEYVNSNGVQTYDEIVNYLKEKGLYTVTKNGITYEYGTRWLVKLIPGETIHKIKEILGVKDDE